MLTLGKTTIFLSDAAKARFWAKVDRLGPEECWEWKGARSNGYPGYGAISISGRLTGAHRVSFCIHKGSIPPGVVIRHECDNPPCVNPNHLLQGSRSDNSQDACKRQRFKNKLTPDAVIKIRELRSSGLGHTSVARIFGVSPKLISNIENGSAWRHVT